MQPKTTSTDPIIKVFHFATIIIAAEIITSLIVIAKSNADFRIIKTISEVDIIALKVTTAKVVDLTKFVKKLIKAKLLGLSTLIVVKGS